MIIFQTLSLIPCFPVARVGLGSSKMLERFKITDQLQHAHAMSVTQYAIMHCMKEHAQGSSRLLIFRRHTSLNLRPGALCFRKGPCKYKIYTRATRLYSIYFGPRVHTWQRLQPELANTCLPYILDPSMG